MSLSLCPACGLPVGDGAVRASTGDVKVGDLETGPNRERDIERGIQQHVQEEQRFRASMPRIWSCFQDGGDALRLELDPWDPTSEIFWREVGAVRLGIHNAVSGVGWPGDREIYVYCGTPGEPTSRYTFFLACDVLWSICDMIQEREWNFAIQGCADGEYSFTGTKRMRGGVSVLIDASVQNHGGGYFAVFKIGRERSAEPPPGV